MGYKLPSINLTSWQRYKCKITAYKPIFISTISLIVMLKSLRNVYFWINIFKIKYWFLDWIGISCIICRIDYIGPYVTIIVSTELYLYTVMPPYTATEKDQGYAYIILMTAFITRILDCMPLVIFGIYFLEFMDYFHDTKTVAITAFGSYFSIAGAIAGNHDIVNSSMIFLCQMHHYKYLSQTFVKIKLNINTLIQQTKLQEKQTLA